MRVADFASLHAARERHRSSGAGLEGVFALHGGMHLPLADFGRAGEPRAALGDRARGALGHSDAQMRALGLGARDRAGEDLVQAVVGDSGDGVDGVKGDFRKCDRCNEPAREDQGQRSSPGGVNIFSSSRSILSRVVSDDERIG